MKTFPVAAVALLIGTSAYAMVPSGEPTGVMVPADGHEMTHSGAMAPVADEGVAAQPAAVDWWGADTAAKPADPAMTMDDAKAVEPAFDADAWAAAAAAKGEAEGVVAKTDADPKLDSAMNDGTAVVQPAALATGFTADGAEVTTAAADVPVETAAAELAPRPATQNYPACRPGRGDDRCIQLYERGVPERLAGWSQPTGGLAGTSDTQVAMGGPYEPIDSATETERLNRQALADSNAAVQMASAGSDDSAVETAMADDVAADDAVTDEDAGVV